MTVLLLAPPDLPTGPVLGLLDALAAQTALPRRVLLAGIDPEREDLGPVLRHPLVVERRVPLLLRPAPGAAAGRSQLVEDARGTLPVHESHWIWFLAPDSRPEPGALAALVAAARRSSRVGVVGPKLVRGDDPRLLLALGHHLTPAGRAADAGSPGLVDQGQLDLRQDVLGVPLAGALVGSAVLEDAGGLDPAFAEDGVDGLDLSWRAHLAGSRVVVAPEAVVRQGEEGLGVVDPLRTRRRQRQVALARGGLVPSAGRALGVLLTSTLAALLLLLVKRPADAAGEWADVRAVLSPARGWGARRRFRRRRTVRPRDLVGLHAPATAGWRATLETVGEALDPRGARPSRPRTARGGLETGPVSEEFAELPGEHRRPGAWSWPLALALLVAVVLTAWAWRDLLPGLRAGSLGVVGPELGPAATDARGLWASALDGWRGAGLGHARPAESWLLPAAALALAASPLPGAGATAAAPALAWLLALVAPASVATAYLALRRVTPHRWPRALLALGWAGLAPLTTALADGRAGPVVVHVLAPLLLAGYAVTASRRGGARRTAAVFATVLGVAVAALWVPGLLVVATTGGAALLLAGRGSARWRGAVLALLPWLLLLPWVPDFVAEPVRLLGGAGATWASPSLPTAPEAWQLLLLHPGAALDPAAAEALPLWLAVPLWVGALGALLLPGRRGRRAVVLVAAALVGLVLALLAVRTGLGVLPPPHGEAGLTVTAWPGTLLSLTGAALLLATGLLVHRLLPDPARNRSRARTTARPDPGQDGSPSSDAGRRRVAGIVGALALTLPVAASGVLLTTSTASLRPAERPLPAVAAEQARGSFALRTLVLDPAADGALRVDLVGAEPEPGRILRDRTTELSAPSPSPAAEAVEALVEASDADEVGRQVVALGAGYVLLRAGEEHPAAALVDRVTGLTRVSSPPEQVLWRVTADHPGRLRLVDADGAAVGRLDATGPHGRTSTRAQVPEGAGLVVAEGEGWGRAARVGVDGEPLATDGLRVALPPGEHEVTIDLDRPGLPLHLAALALTLVTAFLALPFGRTEDDAEEEP